jgi:magnesium transporter
MPMPWRRKKLRHHKRHSPPGAAPGSVIINPADPQPVINVIAYGPNSFVEKQIGSPSELVEIRQNFPFLWVNIDGLGSADVLRQMAEMFEMHALALEDVVNRHQRAKVEQYGEQTFLVTHMMDLNTHLESEQISIYFGKDFLLTFQERPGWDCLESVRDRLRKGSGRLRTLGAGYLAYSLLDAVIDHYFPILEEYGDRLEDLEDRIILTPQAKLTAEIHGLKRELLFLRRTIWPQREALNSLIRDDNPHIDAETKLYLRDVYDHAIRIIDLVETYREVCSDLMDLYLSSISNRMNEIMKVLTVISTIFIPLTFIVGVYGMNFDTDASPWNMPELKWPYGYVTCLAVMALISVAQIVFFRRKGWIGKPKDSEPADANQSATTQSPPSGQDRTR